MASGAARRGARLSLVLALVACGSAESTHEFHQDAAHFSGQIHPCPTIGVYTATPMKTGIGNQIELTSSAGDDQVPPTLSFVWLARAGRFTDPTARDTSYLCEVIGVQNLTLVVTDGVCGDWANIPVECVAASQ